jgi:hypothetical protein
MSKTKVVFCPFGLFLVAIFAIACKASLPKGLHRPVRDIKAI